jgi:predicted MFS family arabinose efflux permease
MTDGVPPRQESYVGPTALLTIAQIALSWAIFASPVLALQALDDLGLPAVWIGFQPPLMFGAALATSMLVSPLTASVNAMRMTQVLLLVSAAGAAMVGSGSLLLAALGSMLIGAGLGPATAASSHILSKVTPQRLQPAVFSIKQSGVTAGGAVAGLAGPFIMGLWDWRAALFAVAIACLATALLLQPFVPRYDRYADRSVGRRIAFIGPLRTLLTTPTLRWMSYGVIAMLVTQYGLITFLTLYLQEDIGLSVAVAGSVFAAAQAAGGVGRVAFGFVASHLAPPLIVLGGLAACAAASAVATASFTPDWPLAAIYGVCIVFGACALGWNGVFIAETSRLSPPGEVGRIIGAISAIVFAASIGGPVMFTGVLAIATYGTAYLGTAGFSAAAIFAFQGIRTAERRLATRSSRP